MVITPEKRVFVAFWIFGVLNNVLYVVILSALVDLVGALVPKATVLLADVLPAFIIKLLAPFFIHLIPYKQRIFMFVILDVCGMLIIAFSTSVTARLLSIMLVSLSSGGGELTFLQLTHYFTDNALHGFSSGTGGAGLIGSFCYLLTTTWLGISVKNTMLIFCVLPFLFLYTYFIFLPDRTKTYRDMGSPTSTVMQDIDDEMGGEDVLLLNNSSANSVSYLSGRSKFLLDKDNLLILWSHCRVTLRKLNPLFLPFMLPLFSVYIAEYIINQGISPTLLFPIEETPFKELRDMYVIYGTLYQLGVFISRSSASFIRIKKVYIPSILQVINLIICILQSLYTFIPNVYLLMPLMFYEGLLGGASYVNVFFLVSDTTVLENREFAMGLVGMSDSAGIVILASFSMWLEPHLCLYQVDNGRPWCRMT